MVRNFATTAPLLCTNWAHTPYELVTEIRRQTAILFSGNLPWQLTDGNGTHLEGIIAAAPSVPNYKWNLKYNAERLEAGPYLPWPEWVHQPVTISNTSGIFIFETMLSWWSRYIGISPYFNKPIRLTVDNCRITNIDGGNEAG